MEQELVSNYVICRDNCELSYLESLAMNGLATRADIENCDKKNFQRIVIELINGDKITSECRFKEEVSQSIRIINVYIAYARQAKKDKNKE
ncbi:MAG: hypothetical protein ABWW65_07740 [Thermoprotei archaeon]